MTRRERLENKLAKRQQWAEKAAQRSHEACEKAQSHLEGIVFGQPILVGHHSEKRHRRAIEQSGKCMDKCVAEHRLAEHHEDKAAGLADHLEHIIFSDDRDAVEAITAKIAELEKMQAMMIAANKIFRNKKMDAEQKSAQLDELAVDESDSKMRLHKDWRKHGFESWALSNNNANIRRYKQRLVTVQARQTRRHAAESAKNGVTIDGQHYVRITFAEKPERTVITALKDANFRWRGGCWCGERENIPGCVMELIVQ